MIIKNEWDQIQESGLFQTTELEGVDVDITFGREEGSDVWGLRVWPYVPEDAHEVPLPEQLEPALGTKARIGDVYGVPFWLAWIAVESSQVASLYARFDAEQAAQIVGLATLNGEGGDDGSSS